MVGTPVAPVQLRIRYADRHGTQSERSILPKSLLPGAAGEGSELLSAVCLRERKVRSFRLDRIIWAADPETGEIIDDLRGYFGLAPMPPDFVAPPLRPSPRPQHRPKWPDGDPRPAVDQPVAIDAPQGFSIVHWLYGAFVAVVCAFVLAIVLLAATRPPVAIPEPSTTEPARPPEPASKSAGGELAARPAAGPANEAHAGAAEGIPAWLVALQPRMSRVATTLYLGPRCGALSAAGAVEFPKTLESYASMLNGGDAAYARREFARAQDEAQLAYAADRAAACKGVTTLMLGETRAILEYRRSIWERLPAPAAASSAARAEASALDRSAARMRGLARHMRAAQECRLWDKTRVDVLAIDMATAERALPRVEHDLAARSFSAGWDEADQDIARDRDRVCRELSFAVLQELEDVEAHRKPLWGR